MNKLPHDFTIYRYGLHVRLVQESDAQFILSLRTNEKLSRYLHATNNDLDAQVKWIQEYKKREEKGIDYYFIYSHEGKDFAVNRIYNIEQNQGTGGSWICKPGTEVEHSIATLLIMRDILFETLELEYDIFDVRKGNKNVQKTHKLMGAKQTGETELDYLYSLNKDAYMTQKSMIIDLLNLHY